MEIDIIDSSEVDRYKDGQKAQRRGRGRQDRLQARHPRRPRPHVPQADGPGAAAHPRAGGRDLQAHRGRRADGAEAHQPFRLHRARPPRTRAEARREPRALRPRHPRQKNRKPRALHEGPPAPLRSARKITPTRSPAATRASWPSALPTPTPRPSRNSRRPTSPSRSSTRSFTSSRRSSRNSSTSPTRPIAASSTCRTRRRTAKSRPSPTARTIAPPAFARSKPACGSRPRR